MSDEAALLAAIQAHPDEDTPRLIYADWLDENGQPERAEFIRLQHISEFERTAEQGRRHDRLEQTFRTTWLAHLPTADWWFVRGMPETLRCDAEDYLNRFTELTTGTFIRELILSKIEGHLSEVLQRGWPASVAVLLIPCVPSGIYHVDRTWIVEEIARCAHVASLRELHLRGLNVTEEGARSLDASRHLERLACLDLNLCAIEPEALQVLRKRFGPRLRRGS